MRESKYCGKNEHNRNYPHISYLYHSSSLPSAGDIMGGYEKQWGWDGKRKRKKEER
jgi:hypothetical protein